MAYDFPAAPAIGDKYQTSVSTYVWDGVAWNVDTTGGATLTDYVLKAGDTMTGALLLPTPDPTAALEASHKRYVDTKIPEAPVDTKLYGRQDAGWLVVPPGTIIADAPPTTPVAGQLWYESDVGVLWIYYTDATSSQWVEI